MNLNLTPERTREQENTSAAQSSPILTPGSPRLDSAEPSASERASDLQNKLSGITIQVNSYIAELWERLASLESQPDQAKSRIVELEAIKSYNESLFQEPFILLQRSS